MINKYNLTQYNIKKLIKLLKFENLNGKDIYIGQTNDIDRALILVDDLSEDKIEQMRYRGVSPACVVETSPKNFQAWVSLGTEPMPKSQRKTVAALFAKEFGGDLGSADANHYGRLAGFTNRKPQYLRDGKYPYVLCSYYFGQHAEKSIKIREWARINDVTKLKNIKNDIYGNYNSKIQLDFEYNNIFTKYFNQWYNKIKLRNEKIDLSKGDFAVTCRMLKEGYSIDFIRMSIEIYSPNLMERKKNHLFDYCERTIQAAIKIINS
jgi:hypothetical protein